jgi:hypothetical protein
MLQYVWEQLTSLDKDSSKTGIPPRQPVSLDSATFRLP